MELIDILLIVVHILMAILLVIAVLLQSGKGGGLGAGFGGASSAATQLFGGRGAGNFLSRSTVAFAVIFMCTSLGLAMRSTKPRSVLDFEGEDAIAAQEDPILEEGTGPELSGDGKAPEVKIEEKVEEPVEEKKEEGSLLPTDGNLKLEIPNLGEAEEALKLKLDEPAAAPPAEIKAPAPAKKAPAKKAPAKTADAKPAEAKPAPKPAENKPADAKPAPAKAAEEKPAAPKEPAVKEAAESGDKPN